MDDTEDNMTQKEMLEKIAELDYSQSQLKDLNAEMRHWLDVADDDMAVLRTENASLKKQVKTLENVVKTQQVEAEPCSALLADELDVKRLTEKKIHVLEMESTTMKEDNKKLTSQLKSLQQERNRDKIALDKFRISLQTLECGIEEAQLGLQHREEVLQQKTLELQHMEETLEECSNIIKDLRLTNHELRKQVEESLDEASFTALNELMVEKEGSLSPSMSFAEELMLLAPSDVVKTCISDPPDPIQEETTAEELPKPQVQPQVLTVDPQTEMCAGSLQSALQGAGLLILFVFLLTFLAVVASGIFSGIYDFCSINTLWSGVRLVLQPYCSVHYGALPPI